MNFLLYFITIKHTYNFEGVYASSIAFLMVLMTSKSAAQHSQLSLSGTYGIIGINHKEEFRPDKQFDAIGAALGLELKFGKHITLGGDVDWQRFDSEPAVALSYINPGFPLPYHINRHQFNIRPTIRYYLKDAFHGLFIGLFGNYSYLTITTSDYPQNLSYLPEIYSDPSDGYGIGGGLTYGYRLKLSSALQVSAFGSHQLFWRQSPDYMQQNHQLGLGLNWAF
ncbi:MAG: DUF3575 domain-containing protein [Saprospiraceae bacterium]|nr:DUF3575 domain-containing protein [Saprospiraceae bacterium]